MSVLQLKDGRYVVKYRKGRNPDDPNREREYFGRGAKEKAKAEKRDRELKDRRKGPRSARCGPTFTELTNAYLAAKVGSMSDSGMDNLVIKLENVILPALGAEIALDITHSLLDRYVATRAMKVKKTTIHRELSDIRAILNWAVKRKLIPESPMVGYELPTRDDSIILPPTEKEFQKILAAASPHLVRAMLLSYHTGLRPGVEELFKLTWASVDFEEKTIEVLSAKKGGIPLRLVPLNKKIALAMKKWHQEDKAAKKNTWATDKKGFTYIVHYKGKPIQSIKTAWGAAKRRAGVKRSIRPYAIRHMTVSNLLADGADYRTISEIIGHSSPETTMRVYAHTTMAKKREVMERLSRD